LTVTLFKQDRCSSLSMWKEFSQPIIFTMFTNCCLGGCHEEYAIRMN
jgi:hypothetical protein